MWPGAKTVSSPSERGRVSWPTTEHEISIPLENPMKEIQFVPSGEYVHNKAVFLFFVSMRKSVEIYWIDVVNSDFRFIDYGQIFKINFLLWVFL